MTCNMAPSGGNELEEGSRVGLIDRWPAADRRTHLWMCPSAPASTAKRQGSRLEGK